MFFLLLITCYSRLRVRVLSSWFWIKYQIEGLHLVMAVLLQNPKNHWVSHGLRDGMCVCISSVFCLSAPPPGFQLWHCTLMRLFNPKHLSNIIVGLYFNPNCSESELNFNTWFLGAEGGPTINIQTTVIMNCICHPWCLGVYLDYL